MGRTVNDDDDEPLSPIATAGIPHNVSSTHPSHACCLQEKLHRCVDPRPARSVDGSCTDATHPKWHFGLVEMVAQDVQCKPLYIALQPRPHLVLTALASGSTDDSLTSTILRRVGSALAPAPATHNTGMLRCLQATSSSTCGNISRICVGGACHKPQLLSSLSHWYTLSNFEAMRVCQQQAIHICTNQYE